MQNKRTPPTGGPTRRFEFSDIRPVYPRPTADWKSFLLDANSSHVRKFAEFAEKSHNAGKKALHPREIYRDFCLSVSVDCENEMKERLGGRNARDVISDYALSVGELMNRHDVLEIALKGDEAERIKSKGFRAPEGKYTHRIYINPSLSSMAKVVELLLDMQKSAALSILVDNPFRFKFISPNAMTGTGGKTDCTNFMRPDRVIVTFHQTDLRQIKDFLLMLYDLTKNGGVKIFEEGPAFSIPYVYKHDASSYVVSFGLWSPTMRYGTLISRALSRAYSKLEKKEDFGIESTKSEIKKALPSSLSTPVLDILHFLYTPDQFAAAMAYLGTERPGKE